MHSGERILVVDDEETIRTILGKFLAKQGFHHDNASSGDAALRLIETNDYDFVITDLMMPGMDGLELLQKIRLMKRDIPVAMITGFGTLDLAIRAIRLGAVDFIKKPFDFENISKLMSKTFERRRREASYKEALGLITSASFTLPNSEIVIESAARIAANRLEGTPHYDGVYLALIESLTNAMEHGNLEITQDEKAKATADGDFDHLKEKRLADPVFGERKIYLEIELTNNAIRYSIRDEGPGFDYNNLPDPRHPENIFNASGRGVLLIQCYMDEVYWNDRGNTITMLKKLRRTQSSQP